MRKGLSEPDQVSGNLRVAAYIRQAETLFDLLNDERYVRTRAWHGHAPFGWQRPRGDLVSRDQSVERERRA